MIDQLFTVDLLGFVAIGLAFYFLGVPLITKFTFRLEAKTSLLLVDIDSRIGDDSDDYVDNVSQQLVELGFEPVCLASVPHSMTNVKVFIKLFSHAQNEDDAAIELFYVEKAGRWKPHSKCVEFGSEYADGTMVTTGNQHVYNVWPIADHKTVSMFSGVTDLGWLYAAHTAICGLKASGKRKIDALHSKYNGDAGAYLADGMNQEQLPAVAAGYLQYIDNTPSQAVGSTPNPYAPPSSDVVPAKYGATLKGAYLMTWQLLWPISKFVKRSRVRQSYARLQQAGFNRAKR